MAVATLLSSTPYDFWRDPLWQAIGVIAAVVVAIPALIVALLAYWQVRRKRQISYVVISDAPVASIHKAVKHKIEIFLNGQLIMNARLLVVKVWNSGKLSIHTEDYFEAIQIEFPYGQVINSDIYAQTPENLLEDDELKNFLDLGPNYLKLRKFPLNPGDSITFTVLIQDKSEMHVRGRIDQGKLVNHAKTASRLDNMLYVLSSIIVFFGPLILVLFLTIKISIIIILFIAIISIIGFLINMNLVFRKFVRMVKAGKIG